MKPICLKAAVLMGLLSLNGRAGLWSEKIIAAIDRNEISGARSLILGHESGCGFVADYSELEKTMLLHKELAAAAAKLDNDLQRILNRNFSNQCFQQYLTIANDSNQAESARFSIVQVMIDRDYKLNGTNKNGMGGSLKRILIRESTSSKIKTHILQKIGKYPVSGNGEVFLRYFNTEDSLVRNSALRGLAGRIRVNRISDSNSTNRDIFDALVRIDSSCQKLDQVKVMAAINENYARDYLLRHCAGDANRIAAIFQMDDSLTHLGILREALSLYSADPSNIALKNAIQYGTKDPASIAPILMAGNAMDRNAGTLLLELIPTASAKSGSIRGTGPTGGSEGGQ